MDQKVIRTEVLLPQLEDTYRSEHTEWPRRNLRFSDAGAGAKEGEKCERQIYYGIKIPKKISPLTAGTMVMFDDGHIHEQDIRRRLRLVLRSPEKEAFDPQTGAKGKLDNTIDRRKILDAWESLVEKGAVLKSDPGLEIKTVNEFTFQQIANTGQIHQNHYDQVQYYLWETKKPFFFVLIKNRNSTGPGKGKMPYLEFMVMPDEERQREIRSSLMAIKDSIDMNVMPGRPFPRESSQCSYCRFKHVCWEGVLEPKAPDLLPDEKVPEPSQEMLESAVKVYNRCTQVAKELKTEQDAARSVIESYFKARGAEELIVGALKATYSPVAKTTLNVEYLIDKLSTTQYAMISKPQVKLLEYQIKAREIDAKVLEDAKKVTYGRQLRVSEVKQKESKREKTIEKPKKPIKKGAKRGKSKRKRRVLPTKDKGSESNGTVYGGDATSNSDPSGSSNNNV